MFAGAEHILVPLCVTFHCFIMHYLLNVLLAVIRQLLVRENAVLDAQDMLVLKGAKKERVEEYARCE